MTRRSQPLLPFAAILAVQGAVSVSRADTGLAADVPEAQRLERAGDWPGLEKLGRSALGTLASDPKASDTDIATASHWLGTGLFHASQYASAEAPFQRTLELQEKSLGAQHPEVVRDLDELAAVYLAQGRYTKAEPLLQRVLDTERGALGLQDPGVVQYMVDLASLYEAEGLYAKAQPLFQDAWSLRNDAFGPDDPATVSSLESLANLLRQEGRYAQAEPLLTQALVTREKTLDAAPLDVASTLNDLAFLYAHEQQYAKAEPLYLRELSIREKSQGPEHPGVAVSLIHLAVFYDNQNEYLKAEPLYRRSLTIREKALGPDSPAVAASLDDLATLYREEGQYGNAEPLFQRALAIREKALGSEHPSVAESLNHLAILYDAEGRYRLAEPLYQRALDLRERSLGVDSPQVADSLDDLAGLRRKQGQLAAAQPLVEHALAIREQAFGAEHEEVAASLASLAFVLMDEHDYASAEPLLQRALTILEKSLGAEDPELATGLNDLAYDYTQERDYAKALPLYERSLALTEKVRGPEHLETARDLNNLAGLYTLEGAYPKAEPLFVRALAIRQKILGPGHVLVARSLNNLAFVYTHERRFEQADPLYRRALAIDDPLLGPQNPETASIHEEFAASYVAQRRFAPAADEFRRACTARASTVTAERRSGDARVSLQDDATECAIRYGIDLHDWAAQGGGSHGADKPVALAREAFIATQRAEASQAGDALANSAARTAAQSAGIGEAAEAYEAALRERDRLDQAYAGMAVDPEPDKAASRQMLVKARDAASTRIDQLATDLRRSNPRYWDYRAPEPLDVATLQARTGPDSRLLHDDEVLIAFLVPDDASQGLVFAISKERFAWAQIGMSGSAIAHAVSQLRAQIDPEAYAVRGFEDPTGISATLRTAKPPAFNRQIAFDLYQALLGDRAIQTVIQDKPDLLFVPFGALTSLPPGLLVTAPPPGGAAKDGDAAALRSTAWLLRGKAVAILPTVASLRTLRQILPAARPDTNEPLLAFADPDYRRQANPGPQTPNTAMRGVNAYYRGGMPLAEALDKLPRLPGTRIEAEALQRALGAGADSLLTGPDASKSQLMIRNTDGRLAKVRVLEFATHALVAGDVSEMSEPALVLAAGTHPEDELLRASEAATLRLRADWVLLSACNTASPESAGAQGLSGLARAFFFAGAQSLLVSHWSVRDDVAEHLVPNLLLAERKDQTLSRAQALRFASLAILDDPTLNAANPAAWAPFTLIGEPDR